jgi:CDP-glucose 4,6-dehydratase
VRPWQHVLEPVMGYLVLGSKMNLDPIKYSESWNFGPFDEDAFTVEDLVKLSISIFGKGSYECPELSGEPHESKLLRLDISKATQVLGWKPLFSSKKAIEMTMNWYNNYLTDRTDSNSLIEEDINAYFNNK